MFIDSTATTFPKVQGAYYCSTFYHHVENRFVTLTSSLFQSNPLMELHPTITNDHTPFFMYSGDNTQMPARSPNGMKPAGATEQPSSFILRGHRFYVGDIVLWKPSLPVGGKNQHLLFDVVSIESMETLANNTPLVRFRRWYKQTNEHKLYGKVWPNELLRTDDFFYSEEPTSVYHSCTVQFISADDVPGLEHPIFYGGVGTMVRFCYSIFPPC
jgi:hypothetical protein